MFLTLNGFKSDLYFYKVISKYLTQTEWSQFYKAFHRFGQAKFLDGGIGGSILCSSQF